MKKNPRTKEQLLAENEDLRRRLEEAEETLRAIHEGEVDALVLSKPQGDVVFTLKGAEHPYRVFVEAMNEGAATLDTAGTVLYCNNRFAEMLKIPIDKVIGSSIFQFIPSTDRSGFESAFLGGKQQDTTADISLKREDQEFIPVHLSFNMLHEQEMPVVCMVAMDLTEHKRLEEALRQLNTDLEKRVQDRTAELVKINETLRTEVTERKRAEEAERKSQHLFSTLFRANPGATILSSLADGKCLDANEAYATLLGYTREELVGKTTVELNIWMSAMERQAVVTALARKDHLENVELTLRKKNGEVINTLASAEVMTIDGQRCILSFFFDITKRKRTEEELRRSHSELEMRVRGRTSELGKANRTLQELSAKLLLAQEEERKRIAGEIHDTLGSCLSGVKFKIDSALQGIRKGSMVAEEALRTVFPIIQEAIEECRRMQQDLRPSILDDLGLLATLSWFCRRYQTIYTEIKVELEQTFEERDVPNALKIVIFRVLQEGMNNIAKHSKADLVHMSLRKMNGRIELALKDNGQGFDLKKVLGSENTNRGLGLTSMKERTELLGGSFAIESVEGKGTTIRASWPLC